MEAGGSRILQAPKADLGTQEKKIGEVSGTIASCLEVEEGPTSAAEASTCDAGGFLRLQLPLPHWLPVQGHHRVHWPDFQRSLSQQ